MNTPQKSKIDVGALGPGLAVLTRHCNAYWQPPDDSGDGMDWPKHGLNGRRHVYALALASDIGTGNLEIWAYLLLPAPEGTMFEDGCWFIGRYDAKVWADLTKRQRIP